MSIEPILKKKGEFEYLVTSYEPSFGEVVKAIDLVKEFIIDKGLIIYGGSAIDYALRLHGDNIYPDDMLQVPDLDMYSPDNVLHSYELADILYSHGYENARAINAEHIETMRVDAVDNHFIADLSYKPKEVFDKLPYLVYNGMRIIHPIFQRIDLHSSLSFPYDNVPREVIFARWGKDVERFNILAKYYPVNDGKPISGTIKCRKTTVPVSVKSYVFNGFAAYAIIYSEFIKLVGTTADNGITPAEWSVDESGISFDSLDQTLDLVHFNPISVTDKLFTKWRSFDSLGGIVPGKVTGMIGDIICNVYSTEGRLLSTNSVKNNEHMMRVVNVQYLLRHFLSMWFAAGMTNAAAMTYLDRYSSLLRMIELAEDMLVEKENAVELAARSPLFPSIRTYGNENINLARKIALNRLYNEIDGIERYKTPQNYYPARGKGHPAITPWITL